MTHLMISLMPGAKPLKLSVKHSFTTINCQMNHPVNQVTKKLGSSSTRAEWNREHSQAKDRELAAAELLCRRLLEEFRSACPGLDAMDGKNA
jgi:hypothetical protein